MSSRRQIEQHRERLRDIRGIMYSMKTLALLEAHKLNRLMTAQRAMLAGIETAAGDLLGHHRELLAGLQAGPQQIWLLVGSERGFCGDFNDTLLQTWQRRSGWAARPGKDLIAVGRKLEGRLTGEPRLRAAAAGAEVAEDTDRVLVEVVNAVRHAQRELASPVVMVGYHDKIGGEVTQRCLLPPWRASDVWQAQASSPPLLNLEPREIFRELLDHYLFAALREILLSSLWAENERRARHLDGAVNRLDERIEDMTAISQRLRQEEVTEELQVILLNSGPAPAPPAALAGADASRSAAGRRGPG